MPVNAFLTQQRVHALGGLLHIGQPGFVLASNIRVAAVCRRRLKGTSGAFTRSRGFPDAHEGIGMSVMATV